MSVFSDASYDSEKMDCVPKANKEKPGRQQTMSRQRLWPLYSSCEHMLYVSIPSQRDSRLFQINH